MKNQLEGLLQSIQNEEFKEILNDSYQSLVKEKEINTTLNQVCTVCGGTGRTKENPFKCPKCGLEYKGETDKPKVNFIKDVYVPEKYKDRIFTVELAEKSIYNNYESLSKGNAELAKPYLNNLKAILDTAEKSVRWEYSIILSAPAGCGNREFMYTFLSLMSSRGYSVAPILNVSNLDISDKSSWKYLDKDILALSLTSYKLIDNVEKLDQILDQRDLDGKSTIVITELPIDTINLAAKVPIKADYVFGYRPLGLN